MKIVQLAIICAAGCLHTGCEHILQEHTLPEAKAKYKSWTADELEFIKDTVNEPLRDVALVLNRTYYATSKIRSLLKRGVVKV